MTDDLKCPVCGGEDVTAADRWNDKWSGWCKTCDLLGPSRQTKADAIVAWKRLAYLQDGWRETVREAAERLNLHALFGENHAVMECTARVRDNLRELLGEEPGE